MKAAFVQNIMNQAQTHSESRGLSVCISVVDSSGLLAGFLKMDDAIPGAIDVSIKKARTASLFRTDSIELGTGAQPGGPIYTLESTNGGLISFGGGVVLYDSEDNVIGAIGISGATVEEDQAIAIYASGRL